MSIICPTFPATYTSIIHHPHLGDRLLRQIVELEVDARADLDPDYRERCIKEVLQRMDADIQEHLAGGDFSPKRSSRACAPKSRRGSATPA